MPERDAIAAIHNVRAQDKTGPFAAHSGGGMTENRDLLNMAVTPGAADTIPAAFANAELSSGAKNAPVNRMRSWGRLFDDLRRSFLRKCCCGERIAA